jgi:Permeases of the drug/metabolite transporter (DMT) superfamily
MFNKNPAPRTITGIVLAAFTIFIWGITFVCTKALLKDFSALEILIIRFVLAYGSLWIMCPHALHLEHKKDDLLFFAAGLCGVTVYQFLENTAILFTSASNVSIIVAICPIFTALTAQIFLHEKHITPFFVFGFFIALAGVALVSFNGAVKLHFSPKGDLMALAAAVSWGFYSLFMSKINALGYRSLAATRRIFFYALVCMVPLVAFGALSPLAKAYPAFEVLFRPADNAARFSNPVNWGNLLFLGVAASALCFAAWNTACRILGTVNATVGIYLIPVVTILFAFLALHERITLMGLAGAVCTICGLIVSGLRIKTRQ